MAPITSRYTSTYIDPQGPGDSRPTALQIIQGENLVNALPGKVFLVTGANDTTGLETARALHMTGARIFITTRSEEKNVTAIESIVQSNGGVRGGVEGIVMELGDLGSVRGAAREILRRTEELNGIICNAGAFPQTLMHTKDGFEHALQINYLGHFLLFQELKALMLKSSTPAFHSRLVNVSSVAHRGSEIHFDDPNYTSGREWGPINAYAQSKTAMIYMANQIELLYGSQGLHGWSLQPGGIASNLWMKGEDQRREAMKALEGTRQGRFLMNTEQGAAMSVWALVGKDLEGKGGKYLQDGQEIGTWEGPEEERLDWTISGYEKWIYDGEKAERWWKASEQLVEKV